MEADDYKQQLKSSNRAVILTSFWRYQNWHQQRARRQYISKQSFYSLFFFISNLPT